MDNMDSRDCFSNKELSLHEIYGHKRHTLDIVRKGEVREWQGGLFNVQSRVGTVLTKTPFATPLNTA